MIDQNLPPLLEQYCSRQLCWSKPSLQAISNNLNLLHACSCTKFKIHHEIVMHQRHAQLSPMEHARGSAENLNIARSAGPRWILTSKTLRKLIFWAHLLNFSISQISSIFHENLKFHHHGPKFEVGITFSNKFSGSSPFQNLNPCAHSSGWTRGNWKRTTDFRAQTKKLTKISE